MRLLKTRKQRPSRSLFSLQKSPRLKTISINVSRSLALQIKLRNFRLNKASQHRAAGQIIIDLPLRSHRQIAIKLKRSGSKPSKRQFRRQAYANILIFIGLAGLIGTGLIITSYQSRPSLSVVSAVSSNAIEPPKVQKEEKSEDKQLGRSRPTRVRVNSVGIDAAIKTVGLNKDGTMETPGVFEDKVGWYQYGPSPGQQGPAVLVGHVDNYLGASVFWGLSQTKPGQKVVVERADGKTLHYSITNVLSFSQDNFATQDVYGDIDHTGLRLITCGGDFNPLSGDYSHNTVVFAELEKVKG